MIADDDDDGDDCDDVDDGDGADDDGDGESLTRCWEPPNSTALASF